MSSPPTSALFAARTTEQSAAGRRGIQAARGRAVLVQCESCGCSGTAKVNSGRVVSMNLAALPRQGSWVHRGCGGKFAAFDIEDA